MKLLGYFLLMSIPFFGDDRLGLCPGRPTTLDNREWAYCAGSKCMWGMFGYFFLSPIILFYLRAVKTKQTNQQKVFCLPLFVL